MIIKPSVRLFYQRFVGKEVRCAIDLSLPVLITTCLKTVDIVKHLLSTKHSAPFSISFGDAVLYLKLSSKSGDYPSAEIKIDTHLIYIALDDLARDRLLKVT